MKILVKPHQKSSKTASPQTVYNLPNSVCHAKGQSNNCSMQKTPSRLSKSPRKLFEAYVDFLKRLFEKYDLWRSCKYFTVSHIIQIHLLLFLYMKKGTDVLWDFKYRKFFPFNIFYREPQIPISLYICNNRVWALKSQLLFWTLKTARL